MITPSEASGSNCTKCVWMLVRDSSFNPRAARCSLSIWLLRVIATQSPTLDRIVNGSADLSPFNRACLSSLSTNSMPPSSTSLAVIGMSTLTEVMSYDRCGAPSGQSPSGLVADPSSPSHGAPECSFGEKGGRCARCGSSNGNAGRPFNGLNMTGSRCPGVSDR